MATQWGLRRRGVPKNITLDADAAAYLIELCQGGKVQGRYISALLRAEHARQEERKRLKAGVEQVFAAPAP